MDIDLLFTQHGESGLIADQNFIKKVLGIVVDTSCGLITLEYMDGDYLELNIPIDSDFFPTLERAQTMHIGAVKEGNIAQAYQIPIMFADDPYRAESLGRVAQSRNPLVAFEYFVRACAYGQPVHREDLDDDSRMGCILGDATPGSLQFAPHLARQHSMQVAPKAAPSGPGPSGPGLGGSGGGGSYRGGGSNTDPNRHRRSDDD